MVGFDACGTYQRTLKYFSSVATSFGDSTEDDVELSDPLFVICMRGFRLASGVDFASGSGVGSSLSRRGFLAGGTDSSMFSVEDGTGFLIKGDLKGLNTMVVLVSVKIASGQREVAGRVVTCRIIDCSNYKGLGLEQGQLDKINSIKMESIDLGMEGGYRD
jgi:hypothetical protein